MSSETAVPAQKPAPAVLGKIATTTSKLSNAIATLEEALSSVLAPEPPRVDGKGEPNQVATNLVEILGQQNERLEALCSRVEAIQSRLEI